MEELGAGLVLPQSRLRRRHVEHPMIDRAAIRERVGLLTAGGHMSCSQRGCETLKAIVGDVPALLDELARIEEERIEDYHVTKARLAAATEALRAERLELARVETAANRDVCALQARVAAVEGERNRFASMVAEATTLLHGAADERDELRADLLTVVTTEQEIGRQVAAEYEGTLVAQLAEAKRELEQRGQAISDAMGRYRGHGPLIEAVTRLAGDFHEAIAERDVQRQWRESLVMTVVDTIGGQVEGLPTQSINYLQRLRELVMAEARLTAATEAAGRLRGALKQYGRHRPGCHRLGGPFADCGACMVSPSTRRHCSCGLDAALAAPAEAPGGRAKGLQAGREAALGVLLEAEARRAESAVREAARDDGWPSIEAEKIVAGWYDRWVPVLARAPLDDLVARVDAGLRAEAERRVGP